MHVGRVIVGAFLWISSTVLAECPSCAYQSVSCGNSASIAPVCDAQGLIQSDDLFCDDLDCSCADGFVCASLRLGCPGVVQGGGRARCLSLAGMQTRYDAYRDAVLPPGPATYPHLNLSWVRFHNQDDCTSSDDCLAMQQFHACGTVLCGSAVVMWKDVNGWDEHAYRVVVEGTLTDRSAGVFDMVARWNPALRQLSCDSVTTTPLAKRYTRQTRTNPDDCVGQYVDFSPPVTFAEAALDSARRTTWITWIAIVSAMATAIAAIAAVIYMTRSRQSCTTHKPPQPISAIVTAKPSALC